MLYPEEQDEQTVELLHCRQFGNELEQATHEPPDKKNPVSHFVQTVVLEH